ncbi:MAG: hypothetical protein ACK498_14430, partial [Cyclobacteriaceae bacterium]
QSAAGSGKENFATSRGCKFISVVTHEVGIRPLRAVRRLQKRIWQSAEGSGNENFATSRGC